MSYLDREISDLATIPADADHDRLGTLTISDDGRRVLRHCAASGRVLWRETTRAERDHLDRGGQAAADAILAADAAEIAARALPVAD